MYYNKYLFIIIIIVILQLIIFIISNENIETVEIIENNENKIIYNNNYSINNNSNNSNNYPLHLKSGEMFYNTLKNNKIVVVMFYAPWCSISRNIMNSYDNLYEEMLNNNILLTKVNCIEEPELYWKYDIKGFPSFILYKAGEQLRHESEPATETLRLFFLSGAQSLVRRLDPQTFLELDLSVRPLAVELGARGEASTRFDFACRRFSLPQCFWSESAELATLLGAPTPSVALLAEQTSAQRLQVTQALEDSEALLLWLRTHSFPCLLEHSETHETLLFHPQRPGLSTHLVLFLRARTLDATTLAAAEAVGHAHCQRLVASFVDMSTADQTRATELLSDTGVSGDRLPAAVIIHSHSTCVKFYRLACSNCSTAIDELTLTTWVEQFLKGQLTYDSIIGEE